MSPAKKRRERQARKKGKEQRQNRQTYKKQREKAREEAERKRKEPKIIPPNAKILNDHLFKDITSKITIL